MLHSSAALAGAFKALVFDGALILHFWSTSRPESFYLALVRTVLSGKSKITPQNCGIVISESTKLRRAAEQEHHLAVLVPFSQPHSSTLSGGEEAGGRALPHGWAIALNRWGRNVDSRSNNAELFYVLGRDCPYMGTMCQTVKHSPRDNPTP